MALRKVGLLSKVHVTESRNESVPSLQVSQIFGEVRR
jgi:hypothetical protein